MFKKINEENTERLHKLLAVHGVLMSDAFIRTAAETGWYGKPDRYSSDNYMDEVRR